MVTYQITDYTRQRAKLFNVLVKPSNKNFYKIDIFDINGKYITSIGDRRYFDFPKFIEEEGIESAMNHRRLYLLRHAKDISKIGSRGWWAGVLLW